MVRIVETVTLYIVYRHLLVASQRCLVPRMILLDAAEKHYDEDHLCKRIKKSLVEIICDTTSVLNLTKHVADGVPRYTLDKKANNQIAGLQINQ